MPSYPVAIFPNIWGEIPACLDKKGGATVCNWLSRRGGVQLVVRGPQGPGYTTAHPTWFLDISATNKTIRIVLRAQV